MGRFIDGEYDTDDDGIPPLSDPPYDPADEGYPDAASEAWWAVRRRYAPGVRLPKRKNGAA